MLLPSKGKNQPSQKRNKNNFEEKREVSKDFILVLKRCVDSIRPTIIITKKTAPKAVARNRIKRLIREVVNQEHKAKGQLKIIVKNDISSMKLADILKQLGPQIKKLND